MPITTHTHTHTDGLNHPHVMLCFGGSTLWGFTVRPVSSKAQAWKIKLEMSKQEVCVGFILLTSNHLYVYMNIFQMSLSATWETKDPHEVNALNGCTHNPVGEESRGSQWCSFLTFPGLLENGRKIYSFIQDATFMTFSKFLPQKILLS